MKKKKYLIFWLAFITMLIPVSVMTQGKTLTADELYEKARSIAFEEEDYSRARDLIQQALQKQPNYTELWIFLSRLYAWDQLFDEARSELSSVLESSPENRDALAAVADVELWSGNYGEALEWSGKALALYPDAPEFIQRKALAYHGLGDISAAEKQYRQLLQINPGHQRAKQYVGDVISKVLPNSATISFKHDQFTGDRDPWSFASFQYRRETSYGPVSFKTEYANRFSSAGYQFSTDAWPVITEGLYANVSASFSRTNIYPNYRLGGSVYKTLPGGFETEAGIRYLNFNEDEVYSYQLGLSKYMGRFLVSGRAYYIPSADGTTNSFLLMVRRYFNDKSYVGIYSGVGSAPSDIEFAEDLLRLRSWFVDLRSVFPLNTRFRLGSSIGYASEKFSNTKRNRIRGDISVSYFF